MNDGGSMHRIEDFDRKPPLSSFLPGVAGRLGVPMWVFYVNRGQGVCSFGVRNKDGAIMEFQPANKAWRSVAQTGFRTFLKSGDTLIEPFSSADATHVKRTMSVGMGEFSISETRVADQLEITVRYFTVPERSFAGLVRRVSVRNTGPTERAWEVIDGAPVVVPFGTDDGALKGIARTIEAWMRVSHVESRTPFYRLKASAADSAEVTAVQAGQYAVAVGPADERLPIVVDPAAIFSWDTGLAVPRVFTQSGLAGVHAAPQVTVGKTPCALATLSITVPPGEDRSWAMVIGHAGSEDLLLTDIAPAVTREALDAMETRNRELVQQLTAPMETRTSSPTFDAYCRQTYLDNGLRGGIPICFDGPNDTTSVVHTYSRKHGDPERDYNDFYLAAEFYSQGNGNYRDVNQNRRCDTWFEPDVGDFNVRMFVSLLQADGYNPLVVRGVQFALDEAGISETLDDADDPRLRELLATEFTPGGLLYRAQLEGIELGDAEAFLRRVMRRATPSLDAEFGEGFWTDHWTYNLDLLESHLAIFPERLEACLRGGPGLPFAQSPAAVRPRSEQYVMAVGGPRRLHAIDHGPGETGWMCDAAGEVVRVTLFAKLAALAMVKLATLDPDGMGVDMEAGKPGWYDALNGLPGLFGSSMAEAFELRRLLGFLAQNTRAVELPSEIATLGRVVLDALVHWENRSQSGRDIHYWDVTSEARESFRAAVRTGFDGAMVEVSAEDLWRLFRLGALKLRAGLQRARTLTGGRVPTYFQFAPTGFSVRVGADGTPLRDPEGRPYLDVHGFSARALPLFLEGYVRAMKTATPQEAREMHAEVMDSGLYDEQLGMFKVNASLEGQPHDIGRCRAFTPGWLENESIWLHMAYKYMLGLLQKGLYAEFYAAVSTGLVAFMDPERYGRSPLENSSFIASSAHPDPSVHGRGFVARLSGSTAEFLHIWTLMMAGPTPFALDASGALELTLKPALPGWLFDDRDEVAFRFLGRCDVVYENPERLDTFAPGVEITRMDVGGPEPCAVNGGTLGAPFAAAVRNGAIPSIRARIGRAVRP